MSWQYKRKTTQALTSHNVLCSADALEIRRASLRSSIKDLVLLRTKLLRWFSFSPHFTQKVSFSKFCGNCWKVGKSVGQIESQGESMHLLWNGIMWQSCNNKHYMHQGVQMFKFFTPKKRRNPLRTRSDLGLVWKDPKRLLIRINFRGSSSYFCFDYCYAVDFHSALSWLGWHNAEWKTTIENCENRNA